jgi:general secretion pathway protein G
MSILASAILPTARTLYRRQREIELRRALREIRTAIDLYKASANQIGVVDKKLGNEDYPEDLDTLVKGVSQVGKSYKLKFLRRIPVDPMTDSREWGTRCYQDAPDSTSGCGDNVFDVYTKFEGTGLNGTPYSEW